MIASHQALRDSRISLAEIETRLATLATDQITASAELETADSELARLMGLERLGEGDTVALTAARERRQAADLALRSIDGATGVLTERLPAARARVDSARAAFLAEARDLARPEHDALRMRLAELLSATASTIRRMAGVDALVSGISLGTRNADALARDALETIRQTQAVEISIAFLRPPRQLSEFEIDELISGSSEPAP